MRILHVLRAPIGGLFRHVLDLTREQVARGHAVGIVTDALTGGAASAQLLSALAPDLALGLSRTPIRRNPHPSDLLALAHVAGRIRSTKPDIVHGHGSKGGVLARLSKLVPGLPRTKRVYTPHGGSLNYRPGTRAHASYMKVEAVLQRQTDLVLFESAFIGARYAAFVGRPPPCSRVVHNGIGEAEFEPVTPDPDATDILYVGELRSAKGIDTLIDALGRTGKHLGWIPTLTLVGSGPDRAQLERQAEARGLARSITFRDPMPAREAFRLGRTLVVPSRAESLPYVILEAAGARIPMIATNVGGIPEIFGPMSRRLISPDSVPDLSDRLIDLFAAGPVDQRADAAALAAYVRDHFSIDQMVEGVLSSYRDALADRRTRPPFGAPTPFALSP